MIRIYDFDYHLLLETDIVLSSEWELKFNGIGRYEGSFPINSEIARIFAENKFLILCEEDRQAICTGKLIYDKLSVYGRTPEWLLSKRIVLPFKTSQIFGETYTDPETIILYLLTNAYITPKRTDSEGNISSEINSAAVAEDFVIPAPKGAEAMNRHFWRNSANTLSEVIIDLCDIMGCGHTVIFCPEKRCWEFSFIFTEERNLLISKSLKNAYDMKLKDNLLDMANGAYFEIYSEENENSVYGYTLSDASEEVGMLYWESLFPVSSLSEAEQQLLKKSSDCHLESELLGISYGKDYKLGDILRVQFEAGPFKKTFRQQVTSVSIISSKSGNSVRPTFSTP